MRGHIEPDKAGRRNVWLIAIEGVKGADGKRKRHYHQFRGGKREADKELCRHLAELHAGTYVAPSSLTVAAWLHQWLEGTARMRVTPKTLESYQGWVDGRINPLLGHHRLDTLTAATIQAAWAELMIGGRKDKRGGSGLSPKSIRNCHGILSTALRTAVKHGVLARNPCDLADLPRAVRHEMQALDAAQINTLLEAARGTSLFVPVLLAATVGLRRGEVLALRWQDVDLNAGVLTVARATEQTTLGGIRMKAPKSERVRRISMPALLITELRAARVAQLAQSMQVEDCRGVAGHGKARHGKAGQGEDGAGLVVCNADGSPRSPSACTQQFARFIQTLPGIPNIRYHDLRHSCATLLLSLGIPLPVVSEILGHSQVSTTANIYAHALPAGRIEAAAAMENALRRTQERVR